MRTYDRRGVLAAGVAAALYGTRLGRARAAVRAPKPSGTLHYYNWIDYVSPETYVAFTKATGVRVKRSFYASNEALLAKLKTGGRDYDLAAPTGYMVAVLAEEGLLERIDWRRLPTVRKNIDSKFLGLPFDPKDEWSVPKSWGTTGFMYRTDLIKERPKTWKEFFGLFRRYPKKLTLLDGSAEVIGSVAVMMGYSYNTDSDGELGRARNFLLGLKPFVHSFDSEGYRAKIARGVAYGGLGWSGDGTYVIARSPKNAAEYVVPVEGGEIWLDAHVIPRGAPNPVAAHAWIDFVYKPRIGALETLYTFFGSPLRRELLESVLTPATLRNPDLFPPSRTFARLEAADLSPRGSAARKRIWREVRAA